MPVAQKAEPGMGRLRRSSFQTLAVWALLLLPHSSFPKGEMMRGWGPMRGTKRQVAAVTPVTAPLPPVAAGEVGETVLGNGLRVLTLESHAAPVASVWMVYKVGSRHEKPGRTGLSHVLEHMMFKGTETLPHGEIDRLLALAGADHNAWTDLDVTAYHSTLPAGGMEVALRIEADRMRNARMDEADWATEKSVILSELDGDENEPTTRLIDKLMETAFTVHGYRWPTIGKREDVAATTAADVRAHYETYYQPNNAILVLVGDFKTEAALELVRRHFDRIPRGPEAPEVTVREPEQTAERRVTLRGAAGARYGLAQYHTPGVTHGDVFALDLLDTILGSGRSSRLYDALVENGLTTDATCDLSLNRDSGWMSFLVTAPAGRGAKPEAEIEAALDGTLRALAEEGVTPEELRKAKNQAKAEFLYDQDSVTSLAESIAYYAAVHDWRHWRDYLEKVERVTCADVQRVARAWLRAENRSFGWFLPEAGRKKAAAAGPVAAELPERAGTRPRAVAANAEGRRVEWKVELPTAPDLTPRVHRTRLANGVTIILCENHATPTVVLRACCLAGGVLDPEALPGLASLTASMLDRGTKNLSADAIVDQLDSSGASLDFSASYETMDASLKAPADVFSPTLALLADCLRNPVFPASELKTVRSQLLTGLEENETDASYCAARALRRLVYPEGHALRHELEGTAAAVRKMKRADLIEFHSRHVRPDTLVLVVAGDFSTPALVAELTALFGDWQAPAGVAAPEKFENEMPELTSAPKTVIRLRDKTESIVMLAGRGVRREAPDLPAALLANQILGGEGEFTALLMKHVRDELGLTYGVSSAFSGSRGVLPWTLSMQNDPAHVEEALASVQEVILRLHEGKISEDDLTLAKAVMSGSAILTLETNDGLAATLRVLEYQGLGFDHLARHSEALRAVTLDEVIAAARKYLPAKFFATSIAGPG